MKFILVLLLCTHTAALSQTTMIVHNKDGTQREIEIETIQNITFDLPSSKVDEKVLALANSFMLLQNYPNPFNPTTTISFNMPATGPVDISIFDITGRLVLQHSQTFENGSHSFLWDGKDSGGQNVASGFYIYQVKFNDIIQSKKMTLIK